MGVGTKNQQLTARGLAALAVGEWANDTRPHGSGQLQARRLSSGALAFYYRYTAPGRKQDRLSLGTELTLAEAREKASELSRRYQAGEKDLRAALDTDRREAELARAKAEAARAAAEARNAGTLGVLLEAYCDQLLRDGKVTAERVRKALQLHVREAWPKVWATPAADVTPDDLLAVVARVADAKKLREADKLRSYLSSAYTAAIKARQSARALAALRDLRISSNPARDLSTIEGARNAGHRALSIAELRAYWKRICALPDPDGPLLRFHLLTGAQRIEQLTRLTVKELDQDTNTIRIMDLKGRRRQPRVHVVPLIPEAVAALNSMRGSGKDAGPYLFTVSEGHAGASYGVVQNRVREVMEAMQSAEELERGPFTPGDLRRTVETRLAAAKVSQEVRGQLQSHGLGGVQGRHYDRHDYADEKRGALEELYKILIGKPAKVTSIRKGRRS